MPVDDKWVIASRKWYNGYAENQDLMADWQYQYGTNINVFDDISWVQLSSKVESRTPASAVVAYCPFTMWPTVQRMYRFYANKSVAYSNNTTWLSETAISSTSEVIESAVSFWQEDPPLSGSRIPRIFALSEAAVEVIDTVTWTVTTLPTPTDWTIVRWGTTNPWRPTGFVYSNSVLLVGKWNVLRRYVPIGSSELPIWWKAVRKFKAGDSILGITLSGNYLKIWISERGINTRIIYIAGTFDVEDGWVVETIDWENMIFDGWVATVWDTDYCLMRSSYDNNIGYFYAVKWYDKQLLWKTKSANWQSGQLEYFTVTGTWVQTQTAIKPKHKRGMLYLPMGDGIRQFGKNKLNTPFINLAWSVTGTNKYNRSAVFGDYLYVAGSSPSAFEERVYLEFRNNGYTTADGIVIDRVYTGEDIIQRNENLILATEYEIESANGGSIEVYMRLNRAGRTPSAWWTLLKTITDHTRLVDRFDVAYNNGSNDWLLGDWDTIEFKYVLKRGSDQLLSPMLNGYKLLYNQTDNEWGW